MTAPEKRCPTCGSDDPAWCIGLCGNDIELATAHAHNKFGRTKCCPDPFHDPFSPPWGNTKFDAPPTPSPQEAERCRTPGCLERATVIVDADCADRTPMKMCQPHGNEMVDEYESTLTPLAPTDQAGQEAKVSSRAETKSTTTASEAGQEAKGKKRWRKGDEWTAAAPIDSRTLQTGRRPRDRSPEAGQEAERCGVKNSIYDHVCELPADHEGPHIKFTDSGTFGWPRSPVEALRDRSPEERAEVVVRLTREEARTLDAHFRLNREQIGRNPEAWPPWAKLRAALREEGER